MSDRFEHDAHRFADFLMKHWEPAQKWEDPVQICRWYIAYGFMAVAIGDNGEIVAGWAVRPVERPGLGVLPYYFNMKGSCLHVDFLIDISEDIRAILALRQLVLMRFGERETVAMFRHDMEKMRVYPSSRFWDSLLKLKKIKRKRELHNA